MPAVLAAKVLAAATEKEIDQLDPELAGDRCRCRARCKRRLTRHCPLMETVDARANGSAAAPPEKEEPSQEDRAAARARELREGML